MSTIATKDGTQIYGEGAADRVFAWLATDRGRLGGEVAVTLERLLGHPPVARSFS
jgi:hypothetical protein